MTNQVIVINGAGGALGGALAAHYAARSDTDLVLSDVSEGSLQATLDGLPDHAGAVEWLLADVGDEAQVAAVVSRTP